MKQLLLLIGILLACVFSNAQTMIQGGDVSGSWPFSGSPYLIEGNIIIPDGATLNIEPGVTVNFQDNFSLTVNGRLVANGTSTDSIRFTAASSIMGWGGIQFDSTAATNDTSYISFAVLNFGFTNAINGGAISIKNVSNVVVANSVISNCTAFHALGGAIYLQSSAATIMNNHIVYNRANAGAIFVQGGAPVIINNTIAFNNNSLPGGDTAGYAGGGISCIMSNAVINGNIIRNNHSAGDGGGIWAKLGQDRITNNHIALNNCDGNGAGIFSSGICSIENNTIDSNVAQLSGGAIYSDGLVTINKNSLTKNLSNVIGAGIVVRNTTSIISNNLVANNSIEGSSALGGGIACMNSDSSTKIFNNIIANNTATDGGAVLCFDANPIFYNNTIVNNSAMNGGALYAIESSPVFVNMLFHGNTASEAGQQIFLSDADCQPTFTYSHVQGMQTAFGNNGNFYTGVFNDNVDLIPWFVNPTSGSGADVDATTSDWSLSDSSQLINKGWPSGDNPSTDFLGQTRVVAYIIDPGAIENQGGPDISKHKILFIDTKTGICGSLEMVAIRTKNMRHVTGLQGTIHWDTAHVKFNGIDYGSSVLNINSSNVNLADTANGFLTFAWHDTTLAAPSLPDSSKLFNIVFHKTNAAITDTAAIDFSSVHTVLQIDTLNLLTYTVAVATDTSYVSGKLIFVAAPVTTQLALSGCDSLIYNNQTYYASATFTDTLRYSQSGCDSIYRFVDIAIIQRVTATVSINAHTDTIVIGAPVTIIATATNAGDQPVFSWFKNGMLIDNEHDDTLIINTLMTTDTITVQLKSSLPCATPDSVLSNAISIFVHNTFTFIGDGNFDDAGNWLNHQLPPIQLPAGAEIIIQPVPDGSCILNRPQSILPGAKITVAEGSHFIIPEFLIIQ